MKIVGKGKGYYLPLLVIIPLGLIIYILNITSNGAYFHQMVEKSNKIELESNSNLASKYAKSGAERCNVAEDESSFHSQFGEDRYLLAQFFTNLCGGSYIEMGALDGNRLSNSFYFNTVLNWKGILIEANPTLHADLKINRPNELVPPIHAAVCDEEREVHWISSDAVGGIVEFAPKSFKAQWWSQDLIDQAQAVKCMPLNQIIHESNVTVGKYGHAFFDFFSLDVEGGEHDVLKSIDFDKLAFGVIFYESDGHNPLKNQITRTFLESKGYHFWVARDGSFYHVNNKFADIYAHLVHDE